VKRSVRWKPLGIKLLCHIIIKSVRICVVFSIMKKSSEGFTYKMSLLLGFTLKFILYIEREFSYGATRSTDDICATDRFSVFKVQIVDPTGQNSFHMKI
jgi:hypothetical protein